MRTGHVCMIKLSQKAFSSSMHMKSLCVATLSMQVSAAACALPVIGGGAILIDRHLLRWLSHHVKLCERYELLKSLPTLHHGSAWAHQQVYGRFAPRSIYKTIRGITSKYITRDLQLMSSPRIQVCRSRPQHHF